MGILVPFVNAIIWILEFVKWLVIIWVVISWIMFFAGQTSFRWRNRGAYNILNQLNDLFTRMTHPFLKPFRRLLPPYKTAGIDWSPMLLWLAVWILSEIVMTARGAILFR